MVLVGGFGGLLGVFYCLCFLVLVFFFWNTIPIYGFELRDHLQRISESHITSVTVFLNATYNHLFGDRCVFVPNFSAQL